MMTLRIDTTTFTLHIDFFSGEPDKFAWTETSKLTAS